MSPAVWIQASVQALASNSRWMAWNFFLAAVPVGLAWALFRRDRSPTLLWWVGLVALILFLPNAPYVLTDIIHLIADIRYGGYSTPLIALVLFPQYLVFMGAGFACYVVSLMAWGRWLRGRGWGRWVLPLEGVIHLLSAVGIYLGRFRRFNSWDMVTRPDAVVRTVLDALARDRPLLLILLTTLIIAVLYALLKPVLGAIAAQWRRRQQRQRP